MVAALTPGGMEKSVNLGGLNALLGAGSSAQCRVFAGHVGGPGFHPQYSKKAEKKKNYVESLINP